jgi:hypothetical protein
MDHQLMPCEPVWLATMTGRVFASVLVSNAAKKYSFQHNTSEKQDLFAKLLKKRFDRQPCCAGILYECMRFLIGHYKLKAAEEFLSFGCVRTEHRLVSAYINRIINVAWCFGHGILLDPETSILCPFQPVLQGGNCEITLRRGRSCLGWKKRAQYLRADLPVLVRLWHETDMAGLVGDVRSRGVEPKSDFGAVRSEADPTVTCRAG